MSVQIPNSITGFPEIVLVVCLLVGWGGAIIHAIRLGRMGMAIILFFLMPGLWVLWWPLHRKVAGTCSTAGTS